MARIKVVPNRSDTRRISQELAEVLTEVGITEQECQVAVGIYTYVYVGRPEVREWELYRDAVKVVVELEQGISEGRPEELRLGWLRHRLQDYGSQIDQACILSHEGLRDAEEWVAID